MEAYLWHIKSVRTIYGSDAFFQAPSFPVPVRHISIKYIQHTTSRPFCFLCLPQNTADTSVLVYTAAEGLSIRKNLRHLLKRKTNQNYQAVYSLSDVLKLYNIQQIREEMIMNILLIGNGFDLAHELPTTYMDFLFFCHTVKSLITYNKIENKIPKDDPGYSKWFQNGTEMILRTNICNKDCIDSIVRFCRGNLTERNEKVYRERFDHFIAACFEGSKQKLIKEILFLCSNNFWIDYFLQCDMHGAENWIDFESEISKVIQKIDSQMYGLMNSFHLYDRVTTWPDNFIKVYFSDNKEITYKEIINHLVTSLNKLIRLFEIYLTEYVEKIKINIISPDIKEITSSGSGLNRTGQPVIENTYTKVLSFNYTNIYEKIYLNEYMDDLNEITDYIHGKANGCNILENNNMVLGIDEYLPDDRKNKDLEFIAFKKYYQRIHKGTGNQYKGWLDTIKKIPSAIYNNRGKHYKNLYIFGHSLDVTDKDVLMELILGDNVYTTIYYRDLKQKGQQIANLVRVIGQDELIRRTGKGSARTIRFRLQRPMENIIKQAPVPDQTNI